MSDTYKYYTDEILSPDEEVIHDQNKTIECLQEQLKEKQQELQIRINDNADMYAKLCNALMQLEEANDVIKGYADAYKKYPDGTMMTFVVNKHPAHHYLDRWGIK